METRKVTLALSKGAYADLKTALELGGDCPFITWPFPEHVVEIRIDPTIPGNSCELMHDDRRYEGQNQMAYQLSAGALPDDITMLVNKSFEEAIRCYEQACFLGGIALCGRTIETVLGTVYQNRFDKHPSEEKLGINAIINQLRKEKVPLKAGLKEKMETIGEHRNMAVHGNLVIPTDDECRSCIYATRDVLRIIDETMGGSK